MASTSEYEAASKICRRNALKDKMERGELAYSFGLGTVLNPEIALMARTAGYDAILMNLEHSRTGLETASDIACACLNVGLAPIVVVPRNTNEWISRALDVGMQGIIVPRIGTAEDAKTLVKYSKYRPIGERPLAETPQQQYQMMNMSFTANMQVTNERTLAMCMIETVEGLNNVEEIAAVDGVDVLFVGTFDLTDDMGICGQYDNPAVGEAYARISAAAEKASVNGRKVFVGCGGLEWRPDMMKSLSIKHSNIRYFMAGRDSTILMKGMKAQCDAMAAIGAEVLEASK